MDTALKLEENFLAEKLKEAEQKKEFLESELQRINMINNIVDIDENRLSYSSSI